MISRHNEGQVYPLIHLCTLCLRQRPRVRAPTATMALSLKPTTALRANRCVATTRPRAAKLVVQAHSKPLEQIAVMGMAALLVSGPLIAPEAAFAASSGGRVSSSGFSKRRSAP